MQGGKMIMGNKVLVAYGSKYGATQGIAEKIGQVIAQTGLEVDTLPAEKVKDLSEYKGVVLGSAAYIGSWRKQATAFIRKYDDQLEKIPTWVFSSGPLEEGDAMEVMKGWKYPKDLEPVMDRIKPRDITVFHGAVNFQRMNILEKWMMKRFKLSKTDFRRWDLIETWAKKIAEGVGK
jgi:menaquinone-dependent protoporphyrinogen oxidase